jgi:hypothetical protein
MSDRTGEILFSIGLLLFSVGNYCTVSYVYELDRGVKNLRTDVDNLRKHVQNLYRINQYYKTKLETITTTKEQSSDSEEIIELQY